MMTSQDVQQKVINIFQSVLQEAGKTYKKLPLETELYERGFGMDSLDAAAFSARLEREFGSEPYTDGQFPQTLADVLAFYAKTH